MIVLFFKITHKSLLWHKDQSKHHSSYLDGAVMFFLICPSKFIRDSLHGNCPSREIKCKKTNRASAHWSNVIPQCLPSTKWLRSDCLPGPESERADLREPFPKSVFASEARQSERHFSTPIKWGFLDTFRNSNLASWSSFPNPGRVHLWPLQLKGMEVPSQAPGPLDMSNGQQCPLKKLNCFAWAIKL